MSHTCPAPDCTRTVIDNMLMCRNHWFRVPKGIRDEVWAAYREEPQSERHLAAIKAAVESLTP